MAPPRQVANVELQRRRWSRCHRSKSVLSASVALQSRCTKRVLCDFLRGDTVCVFSFVFSLFFYCRSSRLPVSQRGYFSSVSAKSVHTRPSVFQLAHRGVCPIWSVLSNFILLCLHGRRSKANAETQVMTCFALWLPDPCLALARARSLRLATYKPDMEVEF